MESKTLLIVEDDVDICKILSDQLGSEGYRIVCAHGFAEAKRALEKIKFNLISMDLQYPDGNGVDLVALLGSNKGHLNHKTPIIVLSGSITASVYENISGKVEAFFSKPWNKDEFFAAIKRAWH